MAHTKFILLLLLLVLVISLSSGEPIHESFTKPLHSQTSAKGTHDKMDGVATKSRKLLEVEVVELDYEYAGPNPKHDPGKGRGGGRSL